MEKKKRFNSKAKGNSFERKICKELSNCLTLGSEEYAVWRSASSGAMATVLKKQNKTKESFTKKHTGDIIQACEKGQYEKLDLFFDQYFVETKHYKNVNFTPPYNKDLKAIFKQLQHEKQSSNKFIFFVFKGNNQAELLISDNENLLKSDMLQSILFIDNKKYYVWVFKDFILSY